MSICQYEVKVAGIRAEDIICAAQGQLLATYFTMEDAKRNQTAGQYSALRTWRNGGWQDINVMLIKR